MKSLTFAGVKFTLLCIFPCTLSESLDEVSMLQLNSNADDTGGKMSTVDPWLSKCKLKTYFKDGPKVTSEKDEGHWDDGKAGVPASSVEFCNDLCNAVKDCTCFIMDTKLNRCNLKKDCSANFGLIKTANWAAQLTSCYREDPPKTSCSGKTAGQECQGLRFKGKCKTVGGLLECDGPCAGLDTDATCKVGGRQGTCIPDEAGNRVCKVTLCAGKKSGGGCAKGKTCQEVGGRLNCKKKDRCAGKKSGGGCAKGKNCQEVGGRLKCKKKAGMKMMKGGWSGCDAWDGKTYEVDGGHGVCQADGKKFRYGEYVTFRNDIQECFDECNEMNSNQYPNGKRYIGCHGFAPGVIVGGKMVCLKYYSKVKGGGTIKHKLQENARCYIPKC